MLSVVEPASQLSCLRAFGLALARDKGLTLASAEFTIRHDLLRSLLDRGNVGGLIGNGLLEANLLEGTLVELPFKGTALPHLLVVVVEDARSTASYPSSLLHALELAATRLLVLALHV